MKHLSIPFQDSIELTFVYRARKKSLVCELASTEIEIFQSLCYRNAKDFKTPLVLLFKNPLIQSHSMIGFNFDVEQVFVNYEAGLVNKINTIYRSKQSGLFIQGYSEFSMVILAPIGFCRENNIVLYKSSIYSKLL